MNKNTSFHQSKTIFSFSCLERGCTMVLLLCATASLVTNPQQTALSVTQGLTLCSGVIIPSLFPFFLLSSLVVDLGISHTMGKVLGGVMVPLFRLQGNCSMALVLGCIGGFPMGAKTTLSLYQSGQCSRQEAQQLLAFVNNAGPAFLLGVVGQQLFQDIRLGYLLALGHILASITVGILLRHRTLSPAPPSGSHNIALPFLPAFLTAVQNAVQSSLQISGFILTFSVIGTLALPLFHTIAELLSPWISPSLTLLSLQGCLEISTGIQGLHSLDSLPLQLAFASVFLGWGGISVHGQVLSLLSQSDLSCGSYLLGQGLKGLFALGYTLLFYFYPLCGKGLLFIFALWIVFSIFLQKRVEKNRERVYNKVA